MRTQHLALVTGWLGLLLGPGAGAELYEDDVHLYSYNSMGLVDEDTAAGRYAHDFSSIVQRGGLSGSLTAYDYSKIPIAQLERTLDAIRLVESSGGRDTRDGDGGRAVGPYQIHAGYVRDVNMILRRQGSSIRYTPADRRDPQKARNMVRIYVVYWPAIYGFPQTPETWSRTHNGGPRGYEKAATAVYWRKVQEAWSHHEAGSP